jgi:hypothetical protein
MSSRSEVLLIALVRFAGIWGAGAALIWHRPAAAPTLAAGTHLPPRRAHGDFSLIARRGHAFGPKQADRNHAIDHFSAIPTGPA